MTGYAKIRFPSALPQLDKEFDYAIPDGLEVKLGQLVSVPFGKNKALKTGLVVDTSAKSEFADKVLPIQGIESAKPLITIEQLILAVAVARRQAGSVGELLSQILPKRFKRAESGYKELSAKPIASTPASKVAKELDVLERVFAELDFTSANGFYDWALQFALLGAEQLRLGNSSLVVLPDFRSVELFELALTKLSLLGNSIRNESSDTGSERYTNYLRSLDEVAIVYGVRSTSFMPAKNLGLILLLDDADESHIEQSAPYWNSRDVLLQRQELGKAKMLVSSLSPSTEMLRLLDLGYFKRVSLQSAKPLVRITDNHTRLDDETFGYISNCLKSGKPVLIQTATLGQSAGVACKKCRELRKCPDCGGRIWVNSLKNLACHSCKFTGQLGPCQCGETEITSIKLGSSGLAEWLGKAFPGVNVVHCSGAEKITSVPAGATLVIATTGAEPEVEGGYACVLIADAYSMVAGSRLRSLEQSSLRWANAASKASSQGIVVFVGLTGEIAEQMKNLDLFAMIHADYIDRVELGLPPASRLVSITSQSSADLQALETALNQTPIASLLRKIPGSNNQIAFTYPYSDGVGVADTLVALSASVSSKSKFRKPGQRLFRISMDDASVL